MKFDAFGNRIAPPKPEPSRESAYWFEAEKCEEYGFCDNPVGNRICSRYSGHGGSCVALVKGEASGKKFRRLEYG